ncbi:rhodanese-like domain-containing protein [Macrococcus equipercicus]|uniref:Rhodanese-like domain-containing protein n=1 Tax=Macrococcus equipercicus TaxID=69967 RepID=A0A9Q9BL74_9STAP|nr:rhodanese-like domain-containing protein [Macrococcus equipercicus]KAA1038392.1 rhodanese-like domain-containing protein [Macrococcus equipercicus]UTH13220.1 rhodanese-like domain-containing protein [Macrococcus equipercicus]
MTYEITAGELIRKLEQGEIPNIIDIREDFEVQMGMLDAAVHIPMNEIPDNMHTLKVNEPYYILCAHGIRSEKVTEYLREHDFNAYNVIGGMAAITR